MAFRKSHGNNPQKIFRWTYIMGAIFGFFGFFGSVWLVFYEKEMNIAKWKGSLLGAAHSMIPWLVIVAFARLLPIQWDDMQIMLLLIGVCVVHYITLFLIARRLKSE